MFNSFANVILMTVGHLKLGRSDRVSFNFSHVSAECGRQTALKVSLSLAQTEMYN
jgi:hypothetical protein